MGAKSSIYNNKNKNNGTKQIIMTISKAMIIELSSDNWWIDSVATRYTSRSKELFVELKEKKKENIESIWEIILIVMYQMKETVNYPLMVFDELEIYDRH